MCWTGTLFPDIASGDSRMTEVKDVVIESVEEGGASVGFGFGWISRDPDGGGADAVIRGVAFWTAEKWGGSTGCLWTTSGLSTCIGAPRLVSALASDGVMVFKKLSTCSTCISGVGGGALLASAFLAFREA